MRIHSDIITTDDIAKAAVKADMYLETFGKGGSRSRKNAFTVLASGNSTRNAMSNEFKAATWDQWGVFLGILFDIDPDMHTGKNSYADKYDFDFKTCDRFINETARNKIDVKSSHGHRWDYLAPFTFNCKGKGCSAHHRTRND